MKMTAEGLHLIRRFEGLRTRAYRCPSGIWTIGYGHTSMAGPPDVKAGLEIGGAEADAILASDVTAFAEGVSSALKVPVSDRQFSALVSFAYNVGLGNFRDFLKAYYFWRLPCRAACNCGTRPAARSLPVSPDAAPPKRNCF